MDKKGGSLLSSPAEPETGKSKLPPFYPQPCRLLVVEDDVALTELLVEYLKDFDYVVTVCHDGKTALNLLERKKFDLILSDIMLPDISGLLILQTVLKKTSSNPAQSIVVLMTGFSDIGDAIDFVEQGAYDIIYKPFQFPVMRLRLDNAVRYQRLLRLYMQDKDRDLTDAEITPISGPVAVRAYAVLE